MVIKWIFVDREFNEFYNLDITIYNIEFFKNFLMGSKEFFTEWK